MISEPQITPNKDSMCLHQSASDTNSDVSIACATTTLHLATNAWPWKKCPIKNRIDVKKQQISNYQIHYFKPLQLCNCCSCCVCDDDDNDDDYY